MDLAGNNTRNTQSLPDGWVWTTLGEVQIDKSKSITPKRTPDETFELYSVPSFSEEKPEIVLGAEIGSSKRLVEKNAVLLCKINPRINRVWIVGDYSSSPKIASTEWIPFFQVEGIEPGYLCYFMQQNDFRDFLALRASGVGGSLMRVKPSTFESYPFLLAPLPEQRCIVAEIETQFTRLDAAVTALERAQANLQRYKASVLKAACEGRLLPPEDLKAIRESPDYEPADVLLQRILAERRQRWEEEQWQQEIVKAKKKAAQAKRKAAGLSARISDLTDDEWQDLSEEVYADHLPQNDHWKHKYKEPAQPDLENLTELSEGWIWASVEQICTHIVDCLHSTPKFQDTGLMCVDTNSIKPGKIVLDKVRYVDETTFIERNRRMKPKEDDVLFSREGALLGIAVRVPANLDFCLGQRMMVFRLGENASAKYYELGLNSLVFRSQYIKQITGTASPHLNIRDIRVLGIPLPSLAEQHCIVEEVERRLSVVAALEAAVEANRRRAERLRQSILKRAFEGRLVPQDPDEEPASVLLKRIQAQRAAEGKSQKKGKKKGQPRQLELL